MSVVVGQIARDLLLRTDGFPDDGGSVDGVRRSAGLFRHADTVSIQLRQPSDTVLAAAAGRAATGRASCSTGWPRLDRRRASAQGR